LISGDDTSPTNASVLGSSVELIERHERDGYPDPVGDAVRLLGEINEMLAEMEEHYNAAQKRLAQASVDEPSLANVEQNCHM
jgi:hypothetical protein